MIEEMHHSAAVFSEDMRYRYLLTRLWNPNIHRACFVMLNPSTADGKTDDATIRSCIRLAKSFGFGGFHVVNLFAYCATDPVVLAKLGWMAIGADNDYHIRNATTDSETIICAWGAHPEAAVRADFVVNHLLGLRTLVCLGKTKSGAPKHPLYIKTGTKLEPFEFKLWEKMA